MSTATKYDARSGFHDVKPLVEANTDLALWAVFVVCCAALLWMLWRLRPKAVPKPKPRTASEFLDQLRDLQKQFQSRAIDHRAAASAISQTVREYLEVLKKCDALELTPKELTIELEMSEDIPKEEISSVVDLVRGCERVSFADVEISDVNQIQGFVSQAQKVISKLEAKPAAGAPA